MTLYEFNVLNLNNKMEHVYKKGMYLDTISENNYRYLLYAVNMFFVEVVYNVVSNKIEKLNSFKTGDIMNKYSIDLSNGL